MGFSEDFSDYAAGMSRLERFLRVRPLVIVLVWGVAAWYWHTVLVLLACAAFFVATVSANLIDGLIIEGASLRQKLANVASGPSTTGQDVARLEGEIEEMRERLQTLEETLDRLSPEHADKAIHSSTASEDLARVENETEKMKERVQILEDVMHGLSPEVRILRDAIEGIDPKAIRNMDEISVWDEHAEERYEAHTRRLRSPYDRPEPSVLRLENEIEVLKRRIEGSAA